VPRQYNPQQMVWKRLRLFRRARACRNVSQACREFGVSRKTYYKWRKEYGGLRLDQAKRFKELERENARLKKLVGEQALDMAILKEAASGNF